MTLQNNTPQMVEARSLTKVFRDFWHRPRVEAVRGIDLGIAPGEIFGFLGPNGSGKSTTLKMILGLLNPTGGTLTVLGESPRSIEVKHRIGYLPEESYLYKYLTARETLKFYAQLFDIPAAEQETRIDQLLDMAGLRHAADRKIGEFSKGMARRIGLAQALINNPDFVILDEPTSGLDPIGCRQVKDLILKLSESGKTVLMASHLLADVEDVCDRIAIMYNGRIQAEGRITELLKKRDVCQFTMNSLSPEQMKKVLASLREIVGNQPDIDHPAMNLEQFFLDVVRKARESDDTESGVAKSAGVADYLSN